MILLQSHILTVRCQIIAADKYLTEPIIHHAIPTRCCVKLGKGDDGHG
jgi:hypothetical protein